MKITIWVEDENIDFKAMDSALSFESAEELLGKMRRRYERVSSAVKEEVSF